MGTIIAVGNYNISVTAFSSDGKQAGNVAISIQIPQPTSDTTAPGEVTSLTATAGEALVNLSWTEPSEVDFSSVEISGSGFSTVITNKGTNSIQINGLTNGLGYTFLVKSKDSSGNLSTGISTSATPVHNYQIGGAGTAGGLVFYDKGNYSSGWRYMECSITDIRLSVQFYSPMAPDAVGANDTSVGAGHSNTVILRNLSPVAAGGCLEYRGSGFADWFLPSLGEMNLLYSAKTEHPSLFTGFSTTSIYWTSSMFASTSAVPYAFLFSNGNSGPYNGQQNMGNVRAVRYF